MYGGNVGQVCRAMKNMGLTQLVLVDAKPEVHTDPMLVKMSLSAYDLYENRLEFDTLAEAVADCSEVAVTTARTGFYRAHSYTAREWSPLFLQGASRGKAALVFGRENHGVDNDELKLATQIVQIPSSKEYTSINLAQAVLICGYELFVANGTFKAAQEDSNDATVEQRERMFGMWEEAMLSTGFSKEDKLEHMMMGLRRILTRGRLTDADCKIMMGLARQADWNAQKYREELAKNADNTTQD